MSATDDLRRMLDERGVEWHISNEKGATFWTGQFGIGYYARQNDDGETLHMLGVDLASAQAVEATLGRGTCRMILRDDICGHAYQDIYECSVCGEMTIRETYMGESEPPKYCPDCGREAV